jgi:hypothetical protein
MEKRNRGHVLQLSVTGWQHALAKKLATRDCINLSEWVRRQVRAGLSRDMNVEILLRDGGSRIEYRAVERESGALLISGVWYPPSKARQSEEERKAGATEEAASLVNKLWPHAREFFVRWELGPADRDIDADAP